MSNRPAQKLIQKAVIIINLHTDLMHFNDDGFTGVYFNVMFACDRQHFKQLILFHLQPAYR